MTDAELIQRCRRALAEIMTGQDWGNRMLASAAFFGRSRRIKTDREWPPIPDRIYDWSATDEATYEPGAPVGEGGTEVDAILDMLDKLEERE